jgi:hypothetical protein
MPSPSIERAGSPLPAKGCAFVAAVEIAATDVACHGHILRVAYTASREGVVALMLRGVSIEDADRMLDPVVARLPKDIPGIVYVDGDDVRSARAAMANARTLCIGSAELLGLLDPLLASRCCCAPVELTEHLAIVSGSSGMAAPPHRAGIAAP